MVLRQHIIGIIVEIVYRKTTLLTIRRRTWTEKTPYTKVREAQQHRFKPLYRLCCSLFPATPYFHPAIAVKGLTSLQVHIVELANSIQLSTS